MTKVNIGGWLFYKISRYSTDIMQFCGVPVWGSVQEEKRQGWGVQEGEAEQDGGVPDDDVAAPAHKTWTTDS